MKNLVIILILNFVANACDETKTIYVADHLADCVGVAPQKCMLIKETLQDDWQYFYDKIQGFDFEEGYNYQLKVKIETVKNPPADASGIKYTLIEVLAKEKSISKKPVSINNQWKVITMKDIDVLDKNPMITFDSQEKRISGFSGCNNFFGDFDPDSNELSLSKMGMTRKMCPDMKLENTFINNLRDSQTFNIENDRLLFYDKDQRVIITCVLVK